MNSLGYNAETGWNFLGNSGSAYDQSSQAKYRRAFENISEQAGPIPSRTGAFDIDALSEAIQDYQNVRNSFGAPQESNLSQKVLDGALGTLAQSFGTYNGTNLENALAGKYLGFF
jgi:hypothetical protein